MSAPSSPYDVAIVGASIAGTTAAILYARAGRRVALLEKSAEANAYKKICTHFIQSSATPTLDRLGLTEHFERAGAIRNGVHIWSRWGWIRPPEEGRPWGYNLRREVLDPMLREVAAGTAGVDYLAGHGVRELLRDGERIVGVRADSGGRPVDVHARLVVGADGRNSRVAELAGIPGRVRPNARFGYFAHFEGVRLSSGTHSQMWMLEPDIAYAFPNDGGITLLACMPHKRRLDEFRQDPERALMRTYGSLPDGPDLSAARRVTPVLGMLDMPNIMRPAASAGVALAGDAALASDPVWGVGCGWAFQSAEWLADLTVDALASGDRSAVDLALTRYRRRHRSRLAGHHALIADFATARPYNLVERLFFPAAARDAATAAHFEAFGSRRISPMRFLAPGAVLRALAVNLVRRPQVSAAVAEGA